ncbi:MAG: hypothetical protein LBQ01_01520 [Prevotellaceae bacterium]|nr:hypothetical protein [Prevotellaceae bacterium]
MNCNAYYNGEPAFEPSSGYGDDQNWFRTELKEGVPIHFMTQRKADKSFKGQYDLTKLAVWDRTLTLEEVRSLGTVGQ